jgi:uncharacterized protein YjbI with pentapeptide repeats
LGLTAFVRERAKREEPTKDEPWTMASFYKSKKPIEPDGRRTDIAAVLAVIKRRDSSNYKREEKRRWRFDLGRTDLQRADLTFANLPESNLIFAHLTRATLTGANLTDATLAATNLTRATLTSATLTRANLIRATLTGATLADVTLTHATLIGATLTGATLTDATLTGAKYLTQRQLNRAYGKNTKLPAGLRLKAKENDPPLDDEPNAEQTAPD